MATFNIALNPAKDYVRFLAGKCHVLATEEALADQEYNKLGYEWDDKVYVQTGIEMQTTARAIMRIYEIMTETIKELNKRIETLCEYNGTPAPAALRVEPFAIRLQLGNVPPNELVFTSPESLLRFERALKRYTDTVTSTIKTIRNRHAEMYAYWKDQYYTRFGRTVDEFYQKIVAQVQKLEFLNMLIAKKRQILLRAQ